MKQSEFEALLPQGREVALDQGLVAYVFPLGVRHVFRAQDAFDKLFTKLASSGALEEGRSEVEQASKMGLAVLPILTGECFQILAETTVVGKRDDSGRFVPDYGFQLDLLPHWDMPDLAQAWWDHNFGEEKKRHPWVRLIEKLVSRLTGKKDFKISELLSRISLPSDTEETTSSTPGSTPATPRAVDSPTEAGQ